MNYVSRINSDFEKSDFKSVSNDHFKCPLFVCGLRNARYTDVCSSILKLIDEKQKISWWWMETIMTQNDTEEYGYIRNIEASPQKKNIPKQSQKRKLPSPCRLCGDLHIARNCPFRYHNCNICEKRGIRKLSANERPKLPRKKAKKARPAISLSVVSSKYETDRINRRQCLVFD